VAVLSGEVTLNGQPFSNGFVRIYGPKEYTTIATIQPNSRYLFNGVPIADYRMSIHPLITGNNIEPEGETLGDPARTATSAIAARQTIPARYLEPETSGLSRRLEAGPQTIDLALTTQPGGSTTPNAPLIGTDVGQMAPDIIGPDLQGRPFKLSDYRGRVVIVTFWAHWCKLCRDRYADEKALIQRYDGQPFTFLGVNVDRDLEVIAPINQELGTTWRSWWDGGHPGKVFRAWRGTAMPSVFLIDGRGIIRAKNFGMEGIDARIDALIAELPPQ